MPATLSTEQVRSLATCQTASSQDGTHSVRGASRVLSWIAQLVVAGILAQTLFFKFTYAPETQLIFAKLGGRPAATITGVIELVCALLLLMPKRAVWGALASLMTISGALASHLTILGLEIVDPQTGESDGGLLFGLAVVVAFGSLTVLYLRRAELPRFRYQ